MKKSPDRRFPFQRPAERHPSRLPSPEIPPVRRNAPFEAKWRQARRKNRKCLGHRFFHGQKHYPTVPFSRRANHAYLSGRPDERHAFPPAEVQGKKRGRPPSARKARQYRRILPHLSAGIPAFGSVPRAMLPIPPAETEHTVTRGFPVPGKKAQPYLRFRKKREKVRSHENGAAF